MQEAYTPKQIGRGTADPQDPDLLLSLDDLTGELAGLDLVHARELDREVRKGAYHTGVASVAQVIVVLPPALTTPRSDG
ncbi:hypothetical protein [Gemmata sp.]|uniref:hypothetical protein n=1 Tax=Gemmata sp. TaxID=1914242 RepID=UPI003F6ED154